MVSITYLCQLHTPDEGQRRKEEAQAATRKDEQTDDRCEYWVLGYLGPCLCCTAIFSTVTEEARGLG